MRGKSICKRKLQAYGNFSIDLHTPLIGAVSRLYEQKGLDVLANILPSLLENLGIQFVLLENGDRELESRFIQIAKKYYRQCFVYIGFQEALSHLIEVGSDFFVMPSRFEPCGLNQMYSMRYGTLPIARATGGLKDTIQQCEKLSIVPESEISKEGISSKVLKSRRSRKYFVGTGFLFQDLTDSALYNTIAWACSLYRRHPNVIKAMRQRAMRQDFSWNTSIKKYLDVYRWAKKS